MNQRVESQTYIDDEIDLGELFVALWKGKWLIIAITAAFAAVSVAIAMHLPNVYRSEVLLAPVNGDEQGSIAGLAGQFGGLANLAGINLGAGSADKTTLALHVLKSREFLTGFIERHNILVPLMAANGWNIATSELLLDPDIFDVNTEKWVRDVNIPYEAKPSSQEAYRKFKEEVLSITKDKDTGMVTVSCRFYSPILTREWTTLLMKDLNEVMRQRDVDESKRSINYLQSQIIKTDLTEIKNVLFQLVEEQTKTLMFANVREEYAFKTVDPAIVPEEKVRPNRALICIAGSLLGLMFSSALVLGLYYFRKGR